MSDLSLPDVVARLGEAGYSATRLAEVLDLPVGDVMAMMGPQSVIFADDEMLRNAARALAWASLNQAMAILDEGSIGNRITLIRGIIGPLAKMFSDDEENSIEEIRKDLQDLVKDVRGKPKPPS